jgi:hypothetical protein
MNIQALKIATDNLSIAMIYLRSTSANFYNGFDPLIPNQELKLQFYIGVVAHHLKDVTVENGETIKVISFDTEARMRYLRGPISEEEEASLSEEMVEQLTVAEIIAQFRSEYIINNDLELPEEAIREFSRINVPHQVWPYWREYTQSTCARMSLPVSIMPMHAVNSGT